MLPESQISHMCLESDGQHPGCLECPIRAIDFCSRLRSTLASIVVDLEKRYSGIPVEDRRDIANNVVEAVIKGLNSFEGRQGARFSAWVWQIYRNKISDYFRSTDYRYRCAFLRLEDMDIGSDKSEDQIGDAELKMAIVQCFKHSAADDQSGCVGLYLDLYHCFQQGISRRELAEKYNVKLNTLNQRIKRCRRIILRMFRQYLNL